jgi:hypothetical protein
MTSQEFGCMIFGNKNAEYRNGRMIDAETGEHNG